jgi:nitrate reductase NapE component
MAWPSSIPWRIRAMAFCGAITELVWMDLCKYVGYGTIRGAVARVRVAATPAPYDAVTLVRVAVRDACVFYVKPVMCLQRSAAVTRMLRRRGVPAELVIGHQAVPVLSHAWVELNGQIVWDSLPGISYFHIMDRV